MTGRRAENEAAYWPFEALRWSEPYGQSARSEERRGQATTPGNTEVAIASAAMTGTYSTPGSPAEMPQSSGKATAALVVAIVGLFICPPVLGVIALVLAAQAAREIRESGGRITGDGNVKAARIVAIIDIAVVGVVVLAILTIIFLGEPTEDQVDGFGDNIESRIVLAARV